jgi:hypothetical protein
MAKIVTGAGEVVIESAGLLHARLRAALAGADRGLDFRVPGSSSTGRVLAIFRQA